jgi:hypothetical protein
MSETRVWIAQCLCPQRHCILATAGEADTGLLAYESVAMPLREDIAKKLQARELNPWCGLCHAPADSWRYEVGRTRWRTMAEAMPALKQVEAEEAITAALLGDQPRSD